MGSGGGGSGLAAGKGNYKISQSSLPALKGTPKQIAWAEELRKTAIANFEMYTQEYVKSGFQTNGSPADQYGDFVVSFRSFMHEHEAMAEKIAAQREAAAIRKIPDALRSTMSAEEKKRYKDNARRKIAAKFSQKLATFLKSEKATSAAKWIDSGLGRHSEKTLMENLLRLREKNRRE